MSLQTALGGIPANHAISPLPSTLTPSVTRLTSDDHRTLLKKLNWVQTYTVQSSSDLKLCKDLSLASIADATLVFAQEEAGTAVCVSPTGLLLTCSHCVAETEEDLRWNKIHWLLFATGQVVAAKTVAWDAKRDLALLLVVRASSPPATTSASSTSSPPSSAFPYLTLSSSAPRKRAPLFCIGHPGSENLEASLPGIQTNYDTLVLSTGSFHGLCPGQDPQDNSEIGALMHDCWTYWGHSGAPLIEQRSGLLVGVHSSWDDETAMRRGVGWEALRAFLEECEALLRVNVLTPGQHVSEQGNGSAILEASSGLPGPRRSRRNRNQSPSAERVIIDLT